MHLLPGAVTRWLNCGCIADIHTVATWQAKRRCPRSCADTAILGLNGGFQRQCQGTEVPFFWRCEMWHGALNIELALLQVLA